MDGLKSGDETDVDCGGQDCPKCSTGANCEYNSDCKSGICGEAGLTGACSGSCTCIHTEPPTLTPTLKLTPQPTTTPTFSPPVLIALSVKGVSNASTTRQEINPTAKLTFESDWSSSDYYVTFAWEVKCLNKPKETPDLVYGQTTLTQTTNEYLVINTNVLRGGNTYSFRLTVSNRYGAMARGDVNVTATRPPWGGTLAVNTVNGTTLDTEFQFQSANWTDDPWSYPLLHAFKYSLKNGAPVHIRSASSEHNLSTTLPLGYGGYNLPISVHVADYIGASSTRNLTVRVRPPPLRRAVGKVSEQVDNIWDHISGGDYESATLSIKSASEVVNYVLSAGDNDDTSFNSTSVAALRRDLIEAVENVAVTAATDTEIEAALVCMESLTSTHPKRLKKKDLRSAIKIVSRLANSSAGLRSISSTAATSAVESISNAISGGLLRNTDHAETGSVDDGTSDDDDATDAEKSTTRQVETISRALTDLNKGITSNLVPGEDPVNLVTPNLGVTNLVIDAWELRSGKFEVSVAPAEVISQLYPPSFGLPDNLMAAVGTDDDGDGVAEVMATSWATNPYKDVTYKNLTPGMLQPNSSVTSLVVSAIPITRSSRPSPLIRSRFAGRIFRNQWT